jgi:hypothetical protein
MAFRVTFELWHPAMVSHEQLMGLKCRLDAEFLAGEARTLELKGCSCRRQRATRRPAAQWRSAGGKVRCMLIEYVGWTSAG